MARTFARAESLLCGVSACQKVSYAAIISAPVSCFNVTAISPQSWGRNERGGIYMLRTYLKRRGGVLKRHHIDDRVFEHVHIDLGSFKDPPEKEASLRRFANSGVKDAQWLCDRDGTNPEPMGLPDSSFQQSRHIF